MLASGNATITASKGSISGSRVLAVDTPILSSLQISPSTISIPVGYKGSLSVTGTYSDGSVLDLTSAVTWTSGTTSVATISDRYGSKGLVSSVSAGSSTVTATVLGISTTSVVGVSTATLSSVALAPSSLTISPGATSTFQADGTFSDASKLNLSMYATWDSLTPGTATVNNVGVNKGLLTAVQNGTTTVSASYNSVSGNAGVIVSSANLQSITITTSPAIKSTGQLQLKATGTFSDATTYDLTSVVNWKSSSTAVAVVTSSDSSAQGVVSGVTDGTTTVTAEFQGVTSSTTVTVSASAVAALSAIVVTPKTSMLSIGASIAYKATGIYSDGTTSDLTNTTTWTVADIAVIQNDGAGAFTALTGGSTLVRATTGTVSQTTLVTVTPSQAAPPTPTGLAGTAVSGSQINWSWSSAGGTTASYRYSYASGAVAPASCSTAPTATTSQTSVSLTGLTASTQYTFIVCALNANTTPTSSAATAGVTVSTVQAVPPNVTALTATNDTASQVTLNWTSGGGTTASYKIAYLSGASAPADCSTGTTSTSGTNSKVVSGLTGGVQYSFRVCAVNSNPTPDVSSGATVSSTPAAIPPDVTGLSAANDSATQVTLSWTSGGGSTASYKIAYQSGASAPASCSAGTTTTSATTSKAITGLTGGTQYSFRVCALNNNGTPEVSGGVTVSTTPAASPPNVSGLAAANDSSSQVSLSWTSGGGSTSSYQIAYQTGAAAPANCSAGTTTTASSTNKVITGLTGGTQYSFRVCAINNNTTPEVSSGVTVSTTPAASPPNVTGLTASNDSATQVTLSWASGGGSTTSYQIAYQSGATAPASCSSGTTTTSGSTSKAITGLTGGTQYAFRVCAINNNVTPEVSSGVTVTSTPAAIPPNVTGLSVAADSQTQMTVSWTSGGGSTSSYTIAYQSGATAPADCASGTTTTSATLSKAITGLSAGTQYAFRVCAANANGTPELSSGVTTTGLTYPGTFAIASATNGNTGSVVTWGASAGAASYTIKYGTTSGTFGSTFSTSATSPTTVTGLTNGITYYFMVTAVNSGGSTNATAEVSATPAAVVTSQTYSTPGSGTFTVPAYRVRSSSI